LRKKNKKKQQQQQQKTRGPEQDRGNTVRLRSPINKGGEP